jgi:MurNAc alpha-1-phosphate uridylyltransferase
MAHRALILAAGRGERLRPLTDALPKPLLPAGGRPLVEWQVERFVVVSGDIHTDFDFASLAPRIEAIARDPESCVAHFVLVDNPSWHPAGDMALEEGRVAVDGARRLTYGNIGVFDPRPFRDIPPGTRMKLFPWMYRFVEEGRVSGERYAGPWDNVGTAEQLAQLDRRLRR